MTEPGLFSRSVVWVDFDPVQGREQGGRRPALVISSQRYLDIVTTLAVVLPITSVDRGWPNHILVEGESGLGRPSWIMTEQPRTIDRGRVIRVMGAVTTPCWAATRSWLGDFLDL